MRAANVSRLKRCTRLSSPRVMYFRTVGVRGGGAEGAPGKRPVYHKEEIEQHVNVLCRWEWRQTDGTYERFDRDRSVVIET